MISTSPDLISVVLSRAIFKQSSEICGILSKRLSETTS